MEHKTNEEFSELVVEYQEEIETPGEMHRMAAHHFMQASRQHELAAEAVENVASNLIVILNGLSC